MRLITQKRQEMLRSAPLPCARFLLRYSRHFYTPLPSSRNTCHDDPTD